jgi:hypothetical protein
MMVRTVRSLEEEARVKRVYGVGLDCYLQDDTLREALDSKVLQKLLAFAKDGVRRALVVGAEDNGHVATMLAKEGIFVTLCEPDKAFLEVAKKRAEQEKCAIRMHFFDSEYMQRQFASSGFDMAVFYASLPRYNEPIVVLKKAERELRAGGKVFVRMKVRPKIIIPFHQKLERQLEKAKSIALRVGFIEALLRLPDAYEFEAQVAKIFKVEKVERFGFFAPFLLFGLSKVRIGDISDLKKKGSVLASILEQKLQERFGSRLFSSYLVLFGTKELGLGKPFGLKV